MVTNHKEEKVVKEKEENYNSQISKIIQKTRRKAWIKTFPDPIWA